jgi:multimeric flavodoxin WrbA
MELKALILNCTLKKSPRISNTQALIEVSSKEDEKDEWPVILNKIKSCDILIIASPIWFGVRSSVAQLVLERLDGTYSEAEPKTGQFPLYGKVGGVIVTGNEDGAHNVAANTTFNLSHLGCTIPPNVDTYWVGKAGPGPSYIEAGGERHLYTNKTVRFMVNNLVHFARVLKEKPIPTNLNELVEKAQKESD